jgi:tRNA(fMet)-specific endonuclease VapC
VSLTFLLDTSIVSVPVMKEPSKRVLRKLEQNGANCAISAPVWHELVYGMSRLPAGKKRVALEAYLHDVVRTAFPILPYDDIAAEWHGRERARLEEDGRTAPFIDGQIAAIAHTQGLTLVTANTKDFHRFAGLETVDWTR